MNFWTIFRITPEGRYIWVDNTARMSEHSVAQYIKDTYLADSPVGEQYVFISIGELERHKYEVMPAEKVLKKMS